MEQPTKTISKPNTLFPKFEWDVSMLKSFYNNGIVRPTPRQKVAEIKTRPKKKGTLFTDFSF